MKRNIALTLTVFAILAVARPAAAHFPWIIISDDGKAAYFFGENPSDRTYHLPPPIAKAEVHAVSADGDATPVKLSAVETDALVGMTSAQPVAKDALLTSKVTYGVYQGSRLDYYTMHYAGKLPTKLADNKSAKAPLDLHAKLVDTDAGVDVFVFWQGKPLADAKVTLYCEEGHEEGEAKTDAEGKVSFTDKQVEEGINGLLIGHTVKDQAGDVNGKAYTSAAHYLTVTFKDPQE